jgi:hypothetical protein
MVLKPISDGRNPRTYHLQSALLGRTLRLRDVTPRAGKAPGGVRFRPNRLSRLPLAIAGEVFALLGDRATWRSWKSSGLAWHTKKPKPSAFRSGSCSMNSLRLRHCAIRNI